jgi:superfamily I DNA/RNA helicase
MGYASKARGTALETLTPPVEYAPAPVVALPPRVWSDQQNEIYEWFADGDGNLVVIARAGSGKTTTIVEGVNRAPEETILLAAFNKRIAEELNGRIGGQPSAEAKTLHAVGNMLVREYWGGVRTARNVDDRAKDLSEAVCGKDTPTTIIRLVSKLHTKAREMAPYAKSGADLMALAEQFECEPDDFWKFQGMGLDYVLDKAYEAMELAAEVKPRGGIDFADMIYLPLRKKWAAGKYALVVVDEAQDMTMAQLDLARKVLAPGGRMCVVGDDRQAIYGFRGADSNSLSRLKNELKAKQLGLTVTYRCGHEIVARAQQIVPDIEAGKGNPKGEILATDANELIDRAQPGDFILSRLNAPLASVAMQLIREGKRADIAGRDIGAGLKTLIRKISKGVYTVVDFQDAVDAWEAKEVVRLTRLKFENRITAVRDQAETLQVLSEGAESIGAIEQRITMLFNDDGPNAAKILCSSVHKAKGLESNRVFLLDWTFRDGKDKEEDNIRYVAVTRARHELIYVEQA